MLIGELSQVRALDNRTVSLALTLGLLKPHLPLMPPDFVMQTMSMYLNMFAPEAGTCQSNYQPVGLRFQRYSVLLAPYGVAEFRNNCS